MKNQKKAQSGGLSIFLSVIVFVFIIGIFVFLLALTGSKLKDATWTSTSGGVSNESVTLVASSTIGTELSKASLRGASCSIISVSNSTVGYISSGNWSGVAPCSIRNLTNTQSGGRINVTYTYVYDADNTATDVMNSTIDGVADAVDWLPLFIVIAAMVAIILLTVLIIAAIKGSGLMQGTASGKTSGVGTA